MYDASKTNGDTVAYELQWFAERPAIALQVAKGVAASTSKEDAERAAE